MYINKLRGGGGKIQRGRGDQVTEQLEVHFSHVVIGVSMIKMSAKKFAKNACTHTNTQVEQFFTIFY